MNQGTMLHKFQPFMFARIYHTSPPALTECWAVLLRAEPNKLGSVAVGGERDTLPNLRHRGTDAGETLPGNSRRRWDYSRAPRLVYFQRRTACFWPLSRSTNQWRNAQTWVSTPTTGQRRALETIATAQLSQEPPITAPAEQSTMDMRSELRAWQDNYNKEQAHFREVAAQARCDSEDVIGEALRDLLAPPPYDPSAGLPRNFWGETKSKDHYNMEYAQVGDLFVEMVDGFPKLSVLVRRLDTVFNLYYDEDGQCSDRPRMTAMGLNFSKQIDPRNILPILPYLPPTSREFHNVATDNLAVPGHVGMALRQQLSEIRTAIQDCHYQHSERIASTWELVAHKDEERYTTVEDIAAIVFQCPREQVSMVQIATLFCYCLSKEGHFFLARPVNSLAIGSRFGTMVSVASHRQKELLIQGLAWYLEYRNATTKQQRDSSTIGKFAKWARALIQKSRCHRVPLPDGSLGPYDLRPRKAYPGDLPLATFGISTELDVSLEPPSEEDHRILHLLKLSEGPSPYTVFSAEDSDRNIVPTIMRATGMYGDLRIIPTLQSLFLREIGLSTPWPAYLEHLLPHAINPYADKRHNLEASQATKAFDGSRDRLESLRHDWGALDVFCIDSADTEVVDDGVSLVPVPDEPNTFWIHVHVADPTSFMEPNDPVARIAWERISSLYAPGYVKHMMPEELVSQWSLQAERPVLTFSVKVNQAGALLDSSITPGFIRCTTSLTNQTLDHILNPGVSPAPAPRYVVGDPSIIVDDTDNAMDAANQVSEPQKAKLRTLCELTLAMNGRQPTGAVRRENFGAGEVSVHGLDLRVPSADGLLYFSRDPTLVLRTSTPQERENDQHDRPKRASTMVRQLMQTACEVSARYCVKRNIPVPFITTQADPGIPDAKRYLREFVAKIPPEQPMLRALALRKGTMRLGSVVRSSEPGSLVTSEGAFDAYIQITSPLRRYGDMVAHWQIARSLQLEAAAGGALQRFAHNDSRLPFTHDEIAALVPRIQRYSHYWRAVQNRLSQWWTTQFMWRALRFGEEDPIPRTVEVMVTRQDPEADHARVQIPVLGLKGYKLLRTTVPVTPTTGYAFGEWWLAEFQDVPDAHGQPYLIPIRRLGREYGDGYRADAT